MEDLRILFADSSPEFRQNGLDDEMRAWFADQRHQTGIKLVDTASIAQCRQFAKRGVPAAHRPRLYQCILGCEPTDRDVAYYEHLTQEAEVWESLCDDLVRLDVRATSNDDNYFIFEDMMDSVLLAFLRDKWVLANASAAPMTIAGHSRGGQRVGTFPSCGVVPFKGISLLTGPIVFMYNKPEYAYFTFRQMYVKYLCKLHTMSSQRETMLHLCKTFESLVETREPEMCYHLLQLGVYPLRIAFPWLFSAFVGYLEIEQVVHVWDRIVGYDSLMVLPTLAAAIFVFRSRLLLKATSSDEVHDIFSDPTRLNVVALLQHFLFQSDT
eukprot:TRINITY_DN5202_c0_g1_i1.p1 TRINITY_DN5202_c0_g1~~TRINITY_DN5202_c0_g1_i1.p1  ORF type:complete len:325 (-),score=71.51 TRINITY_DN5202_c0_g1_i1:1086-2060(-)